MCKILRASTQLSGKGLSILGRLQSTILCCSLCTIFSVTFLFWSPVGSQIWHGIGKNKFADICTNLRYFPVNIYQFKVDKEKTKKWCEICLKLTVKTPERYWHRPGVLIVNSEHILLMGLVFSLLTLTNKCRLGDVLRKRVEGYVWHKPVEGISNKRVTLLVLMHLLQHMWESSNSKRMR